MITQDQIHALAPSLSAADLQAWTAALQSAQRAGLLNTGLREAHFIATVAVETWSFTKLRESFRYNGAAHLLSVFPSEIRDLEDATALMARGEEAIANRVYAGRYGNGDEASGDGWRFRGGGAIALTFRSNYRVVGALTSMPLESEPELLEKPDTACRAAAIWWDRKGCNAFADQNDAAGVRRLVNGPALEGLGDVEHALDVLRRIAGAGSQPSSPPTAMQPPSAPTANQTVSIDL